MCSLIYKSKGKKDLYLASSLCEGLQNNNIKQVITLLKQKQANPNILIPYNGITPFHLVTGMDSEVFAEKVIKLFLQYGGNPNVKSIDAMTPVHVAAAWGRVKILELLLTNGGDPLSIDFDNCSPFHYAFEGEHYEAVSVLTKYCRKDEMEYFGKYDECTCSMQYIKGSSLSELNDDFLSFVKFNNKNIKRAIMSKKNINCKLLLSKNVNMCTEENLSWYKFYFKSSFNIAEEEYKYKDLKESILLLKTKHSVLPSCALDINTSYYSGTTEKYKPLIEKLNFLDNVKLRQRLKNFGENPGPITNTTYHLYLKHLYKLESQNKNIFQLNANLNCIKYTNNFHNEIKSSHFSIDWIKRLSDFETIEEKVFQEFSNPKPFHKWREGNNKNSFNYLLLDPRITKDLPKRADKLNLLEKWETFLSAIFYVGKGKQSRPYAHLYDAFQLWVSHNQQKFINLKNQTIIDIWNEGKGVIVLHVFHNTIPVEAYTREAAMIEMLGIQKLGNCKYGNYYGVVATWKQSEKYELGRYLLFKALQILLLEGERQIFPDNL